MKLADGKPVELRLMAAMAQLNCGSCGYLCKTYAEAIAEGKEKNQTLCSPGGTDTAKMVRLILKEKPSKDNPTKQNSSFVPRETKTKGTRNNPAIAKRKASDRLNGQGSAKDTRHVAIDLSSTELSYRVGDALGVWAGNCNELIHKVLAAAKLDPRTQITTRSDDQLSRGVEIRYGMLDKCLRSIPASLVELGLDIVRGRSKQNGSIATDAKLAEQLEAFVNADEMFDWDVLEFLKLFPSISWEP